MSELTYENYALTTLCKTANTNRTQISRTQMIEHHK